MKDPWQQVREDVTDLMAGRKTRRQREQDEDDEVLRHLLRFRLIDPATGKLRYEP